MSNSNLIENRQIRVFISSTFRDMQDERDYLMKRTFPKLRKLAAERDVTLTELDLRWGITEEEAKSGKVVEICLREIENSIPFFIGIIGNRYGWVPEKSDLGGSVTERFPDVNKFIELHLSVTEMEMQFGVLSREEDMHAYFFIKEQEEDPEKVDYPEMLYRLKQEVSKSKYPSSGYKSPEDLAKQVEEAFIKLLDTLFPKGNLSELEKERIGQRSFMNQLCQNYIKDERNYEVLDKWLADEDSHQFVVTGASGLGKSALIANWLKEKLTDNNCEYNIIYHFTGNGGSESSSEHITKSIANEIKDIYGWEDDELGSETKLEDLFIKVSSEGDTPLLIVIDAINQIVDVDNAKLLNWLPVPTKGIKILFSTLEDDRTMEVFKHREYPIFRLQPLDIERRSQLVRNYLKLYAKSLTDQQVRRIATDSQCENTLVLNTLLDELINFGIHEKLDERIEYYLATESIDDFYQNLLQRYEEDYGCEFVKHALSLILVSKEGLQESIIQKLTEVPTLIWSQLYCSFINYFVVKNGNLNFSHSYIRGAVFNRYLKEDKEWEKDCRYDILSQRIQELQNDASAETFCEIAFQLYMLCEDKELYNWIGNLSTLALIYYYERQNAILYWERLISRGYNMDIYKTADDVFAGKQHKTLSMIGSLLSFFKEFGRYDIECELAEKHLQNLMSNKDISSEILIPALNNLGNTYYDLDTISEGNEEYFHKSFEYYFKAYELARDSNNNKGLVVAYNGCADLCLRAKDYEKAIDLSNLALELSKKHCPVEIPMCLNNLAQAYDMKNEWAQAIYYSQECISLIIETDGTFSEKLAVAYYNLTYYYYRNKQYKEAFDTISESIRILKKMYNEYHDIDSYITLQNEIKRHL